MIIRNEQEQPGTINKPIKMNLNIPLILFVLILSSVDAIIIGVSLLLNLPLIVIILMIVVAGLIVNLFY